MASWSTENSRKSIWNVQNSKKSSRNIYGFGKGKNKLKVLFKRLLFRESYYKLLYKLYQYREILKEQE